MSGLATDATRAALEQSYAVAAEQGVEEQHACLAGRRVRFRSASAAVADGFRAAFAHVWVAGSRDGAEDEPTALTIDMWDSSGGAPVPVAMPQAAGDEGWYDRDGDRQVYLRPGRGIVSMLDAGRRHAWWWIEDGDRLPWFEQAAPMRHLLHWWAASEGLALAHAAAIGHDDAAALVVGPGGSGKSTLALAALAAGLRYLGDDMVVLERGDPWQVHSIWATARLVDGGEHRVPHVRARRLVEDGDPEAKLVADVVAQFGSAVARSAPIAAVVVPQLGDPSPPERIAGGVAARALAPSTFLHMPGGEPAATLATMARLLEAVPAYRLGVGPDLAAAIGRIDALLDPSGGA